MSHKKNTLENMSDEEKNQHLSSLSIDELLEITGHRKHYNHNNQPEPAWKRLGNGQCHICHKPISDEMSLKVKIGGSHCRPRIEKEMGCGSEIWDNITKNELEIIWTQFNIHGVYINNEAHEVKQVHEHKNGRLVVFTLHNTDKVLVKNGSIFNVSSLENARKIWSERKYEATV